MYCFFPRISFLEAFVLFMIYGLVLFSENDPRLSWFFIADLHTLATGFIYFNLEFLKQALVLSAIKIM